ncbi:MAG: MFS transporter [Ahrensia sp.]|nr:MFS transporter [Ahrensia sp.]
MTRQIVPILALLGSMIFLMLGGGLQAIVIPVRGEIEGFSAFELGWIGTGWAIGFTVGCIIVPRLVRRAGHVRTFSTLVALLSISVLLNGLVVEALFWIVLRALAGFCFAGCYMVAESWLNERVSNDARGQMFSIYAITTMVAMAAGQYMLVIASPTTQTLFMIGAILYALAVVPTALSTAQSPAPLTDVKLDLPGLFRNSPAAAVGAIMSGVISAAWTNFGPVFGQQVGFGSAAIASLLAVAMGGSIVFQYPLGRLSDMIDRRYVMVLAGVIGVLFGSIMTVLTNAGSLDTLFFICVFAYGGVIYSVYSLAVAHANDYADADSFVKISSGLLILYGFGTMVGPLLTAQLMEIFGPSGVFTTTTLAHIIFAAYALYRTFRRARASEVDRTDFRATGSARTQTPESYALDPRSTPDAYRLEDDDELPPMPPPVDIPTSYAGQEEEKRS